MRLSPTIVTKAAADAFNDDSIAQGILYKTFTCKLWVTVGFITSKSKSVMTQKKTLF
jgi:hypothetical protein